MDERAAEHAQSQAGAPRAPELVRRTFAVDGVCVDSVRPAAAPAGDDRPPLLCIHGGMHGAWCWEDFLDHFAAAGWHACAFDWYHHQRSRRLAPEHFLRRSIADVCEEIGKVAAHLGRPPVLVGHSMGALAAQVYASQARVEALVLVTPVAPAAAGAPPVALPLPLADDRPFDPPPFEIAQALFLHGVPEPRARALYARLVPESPRAVREATGHSLAVDTAAVRAPVLALAGEVDVLAAPEVVQRVAALYGGDYECYAGKGHSLLVEPGWRTTADRITGWLQQIVPA